MTPRGRSAASEAPAFAGLADRPTCPRCEAFLRDGHTDDPGGLCDPCRKLVESCAPFAGIAAPVSVPLSGPAPEHVNLLELVAGILLTHDALHPGEPLHLREALAVYGMEIDHVQTHKIVNKLRRRHGMVVRGTPRQAGYALEDWTYVQTWGPVVKSSLREG
jgi:hypothetical protein